MNASKHTCHPFGVCQFLLQFSSRFKAVFFSPRANTNTSTLLHTNTQSYFSVNGFSEPIADLHFLWLSHMWETGSHIAEWWKNREEHCSAILGSKQLGMHLLSFMVINATDCKRKNLCGKSTQKNSWSRLIREPYWWILYINIYILYIKLEGSIIYSE